MSLSHVLFEHGANREEVLSSGAVQTLGTGLRNAGAAKCTVSSCDAVALALSFVGDEV